MSIPLLLSPFSVPHPSKASAMLRACRLGAIRELQYLYHYFDIIPGSDPISYPLPAPTPSTNPSSPNSPKDSPEAPPPTPSDPSLLPPTSPPPTHSLLAAAVVHAQPTILSDLLQTFPRVRVTPQLLELCVAEGDVACLDLLLLHDASAVDTCVATYPGDEVGASLLQCAVQVADGGEMARCLLHHGAGVRVGRWGGGGDNGPGGERAGARKGLGVVRLALRVGRMGGEQGAREVGSQDALGKGIEDNGQAEEGAEGLQGDGSDEESYDGSEEEDLALEPDLELIKELIARGADVSGALEDAVELGPEFVAAVLKGKPRPSAGEIREALSKAKKAELVILKEKMEIRKRESMDSLRSVGSS